MWSWKLDDLKLSGMNTRQWTRYHLMKLDLAEDIDRITRGGKDYLIAPVFRSGQRAGGDGVRVRSGPSGGVRLAWGLRGGVIMGELLGNSVGIRRGVPVWTCRARVGDLVGSSVGSGRDVQVGSSRMRVAEGGMGVIVLVCSTAGRQAVTSTQSRQITAARYTPEPSRPASRHVTNNTLLIAASPTDPSLMTRPPGY
jgi:hypothetical protein